MVNFKGILDTITNTGRELLDNFSNRNNQQFKVNPQRQQELDQRFAQRATASPLKFMELSTKKLQDDYTYSPDKINFRPPFQQEMRQVSAQQPTPITPVTPITQRLDQAMTRGTDYGKRIAEGTGKFLSGVADWTVRPIITRPIQKASMSIEDAFNKKPSREFKSFIPEAGLQKTIFGSEPLTSYQKETGQAQDWFASLGIQPETAQKLGLVAGVANFALDLPGGGLLKKGGKEVGERAVKKLITKGADDAIEMAWKAKDKSGRLKRLMSYGDELLKQGFSRDEIGKLSAKSGSYILDNNLTPQAYRTSLDHSTKIAKGTEEFVSGFKDYVGQKQSAKWDAIIVSQPFKKLDELGTLAFDAVQQGNHKSAFADLRGYFDDVHKRLTDAGIRVGYQENYLPQMWKNSEEEVALKLGRKISKGSPFSMRKIIDSYREGINLGLTPKYSTITELIQATEASVQKSVADKSFFEWLKAKKFILTDSQINNMGQSAQKLTKDWLYVDANTLGTALDTKASFRASTEIRNILENYLTDYGNPAVRADKVAQFLRGTASAGSRLKSRVLTSGLAPGTALNSYGFITAKRFVLASDNPIKGTTKALAWLVNPSKADEFLEANMKEIPDAVRHGLTVDSKHFDMGDYIKSTSDHLLLKGHAKFEDVMQRAFENPLFQKTLPAFKVSIYRQNVDILLKEGFESKQAKMMAAETTNEMLTGNNLDMLMTSKPMNTLLRAFWLAPSYYSSSAKVAKGIIGNITGKIPNKLYEKYLRNTIFYRLTTEALNKSLTGRWQFQNPEGDKGNIGTPIFDKNGKQIYIKGTGEDYINIPLNVLDGLTHGDTGVISRQFTNRYSPIVQLGRAVVENEDYRGKPITNSYDTFQEKLGKQLKHGSQYALTPHINTTIDFATGEKSGLESLARAGELPIKFKGGAYSDKEKDQADLMRSGGATNEEIGTVINAGKSYNQPAKLSIEEQNENLKEGLSINTERNIFGKPKKTQSIGKPLSPVAPRGSETTERLPGSRSLIDTAKAGNTQASKNKIIKQAYESLDTEEQINRALQANGISAQEGEYYMLSTLGVENGERGDFLQEMLKESMSAEEFESLALSLAKERLLSTGVTAQWLREGSVTKEQKKFFDNKIKEAKGQKVSTTGTGSGSKKLPPKLKLPAVKAPRALRAVPSIKGSRSINTPFATPKIGRGRITEIGRLPSLGQQKANQQVQAQFSKLPNAPRF